MGRSTTSDIVYYEQLGRALSVKSKNIKEEMKYNNIRKYIQAEQKSLTLYYNTF